MSDIKVNNIQSLSGTNGPEISGTVEMNSTGAMSLPRGDTAYRGSRGRGIWGGGYGASSPYPNLATMDYVQIATTGIGYDFGDLVQSATVSGGTASSTRGIFSGGRSPGGSNSYNVMQYVTISSTGNAFDFGDLTYKPTFSSNASNNTRAVFAGGYNGISPYSGPSGVGSPWKYIDYATIASTGNASSFGELSLNRAIYFSASSPTRGVFGAGRKTMSTHASGITHTNVIDFVTFATQGNAIDFGDCIQNGIDNFFGNAGNSSTRAIICSGDDGSGNDNELSYITLASKGDAIDFGDSIDTTAGSGGSGTSNQTRGVYRPASGNTDTALETTLIATLGNSTAFGDLNTGRRVYGSLSDSHGGLG
jgi:hypothetical protein